VTACPLIGLTPWPRQTVAASAFAWPAGFLPAQGLAGWWARAQEDFDLILYHADYVLTGLTGFLVGLLVTGPALLLYFFGGLGHLSHVPNRTRIWPVCT
jgi:hypothetical protein